MLRVLLLCLIVGYYCDVGLNTLEGDTRSDEQEVRPLVSTGLGFVEGQFETTARNKTYASYYGIPYARPPLGELRFKSPMQPIPWKGVLVAAKQKEVCTQLVNPETTRGSEDCLYLNIYSPKGGSTKLPVMVHIHGGAYISGSSEVSVDPFLENDVVVVSIAYRLDIVGFLSLDTKDVPGNAGLKDQVAALKWIKDNIGNFRGDEDNITIFGLSAGGWSVSNLQLSPLSRGLFHKAIAMSGTFITQWGFQRKPEEMVQKLQHLLKTNNASKDKLLRILQNMDIDHLIKTSHLVKSDPGAFERETPFGVVIEKHRHGAFFDKKPLEYLTLNDFSDIPVILGYSSKEFVNYANRELISSQINNNIAIVPLTWRMKYPKNTIDRVAGIIRNFYFGKRNDIDVLSDDNYEKAIDLLGDILFIIPTLQTAPLLARYSNSSIYLYRFSYRGTLNNPKIEEYGIQGASHGDDGGYLTLKEQTRVDDKSSGGVVRNRMVKMFSNFAKTGNPTPGPVDNLLNRLWLPVTEVSSNYLEINGDIVPSTDADEHRRYFWEDLEIQLSTGILI